MNNLTESFINLRYTLHIKEWNNLCGRFSNVIGIDVLLSRFDITSVQSKLKMSYNVTPSSNVPVIIYDRQNQTKVIIDMEWGFLPFWVKNKKSVNRPINAKSETVMVKKFFRSSFEKNRCIIPISGFYEWKKENSNKQPYFIQNKSKRPMGLAGIYDISKSKDQENRFTFAILTTESDDMMKSIHNRMPVVLSKYNENNWLRDQDVVLLAGLLQQTSHDELEYYMISNYVNNPRNKSEECIKPITDKIDKVDTSQGHLDDFF